MLIETSASNTAGAKPKRGNKMGERIYITLTNGNEQQAGALLYLHSGVESVKPIIEKLRLRMVDRLEDLDYCFARLVQIACDEIEKDGDRGVGVEGFATPAELRKWEKDEGGAVIVDLKENKIEQVAFCEGYEI